MSRLHMTARSSSAKSREGVSVLLKLAVRSTIVTIDRPLSPAAIDASTLRWARRRESGRGGGYQSFLGPIVIAQEPASTTY